MSIDPYKAQPPSTEPPAARASGCWKIGVLAGCGSALLLIGAVVAMLSLGKRSADAELREYWSRIESASAEELEAFLHPELTEQLDSRELFIAMLKQIPAQHGEFQGLSPADFEASTNFVQGRQEEFYRGTFQFAQGELPLQLIFWDSQLAGFTFEDTAAAETLFSAIAGLVPDDRGKHRQAGKDFVRALLTGNAESAWERLSQPVREELGRKGLEQLAADFAKEGELENLRLHSESRPAEAPGTLELVYRGSLGQQEGRFVVRYQFVGWNAHLVSFDWGRWPENE